jgi:hypothetical protein
MPKYIVNVTQTLVNKYEPVEIDAENEADAKQQAEALAYEEGLDEDNSEATYTTTAELTS